MPQDYTIKEWKPWVKDGQVVADNHGNLKGSVVFVEHQNEPVDATFKPPVEVGQKKYGVVEEYLTQSGAPRIKFTRKNRPDSKPGGKRDDSAIRAQWAIGQAVQIAITANSFRYDVVEGHAKELFAMVDRIKGSVVTETPSLKPAQSAPDNPNVQSNTNAELNSLASTYGQDVVADVPDEPISLDDIPFN